MATLGPWVDLVHFLWIFLFTAANAITISASAIMAAGQYFCIYGIIGFISGSRKSFAWIISCSFIFMSPIYVYILVVAYYEIDSTAVFISFFCPV